jgi:hypothetical protein
LVHDVFDNRVTIAQFHSPPNALDFTIEAYAEKYPFTCGADEMPDLMRMRWG